MDSFSQRFGFTPRKTTMQIESMDSDLRNSLWNILVITFWEKLEGSITINYDLKESSPYQYIDRDDVRHLVKSLWFSYFKMPLALHYSV